MRPGGFFGCDPFVSAEVVESSQPDYFPAAALREGRFSTPPLDF